MPRTIALVLLAGVVVGTPAHAQDCFPYATTTRFAVDVPLDQTPVCLTAEGTLLFMVTTSHLVCVDTTDPAGPAILGQVAHGVTPGCCTLFAGRVVIGGTAGLRVFDVSDPVAPSPLGAATTVQPVEDLASCGGLLVAAVGWAGLHVFEISPAGVPSEIGDLSLEGAAHGVAARGPQRLLAATDEGLLDVSLTIPAQPAVLQTLTPATLPENWPHYVDVDVFGTWAVLAMWEEMPIARGDRDDGDRDWGDAVTLMLLDLTALDPEDLVVGHWTGDWQGGLALDAVTADRVIAHDRHTLLVFPLAAPQPYPTAWQPLVAMDADEAIAGAAITAGSITVATAQPALRLLPPGDLVVVPAIARFAPGEYVRLLGKEWAFSYTPHGFYSNTSYEYHLWDLRTPTTPVLMQTVYCQAGFEFSHSATGVASAGALVVREDDTGWGETDWLLQHWLPGATTQVPLPTARESAVFMGDVLLAMGHDMDDWSAPAGIEVVDVADPANPVVRSFLPLAGASYYCRLVQGQRLLTGKFSSSADSLLVIDVTDPDHPVCADALQLTVRLWLLQPWGDRVIAADVQGGFWVLGLDPLREIGHLPGTTPIADLEAEGDIAWVLWKDDGLVAVNLADPAAPQRRGACMRPSDRRSLEVDAGFAYVASGVTGLQAIDVRDADHPVWLGGGGDAAGAVVHRGTCLVVPGAVLPIDCGALLPVPQTAPTPVAGVTVRAHPNPFNPRTMIHADVPRAGAVTLAVYDLRGRRVVELWRGVRAAGPLEVTWNGADDTGRAQPSGVYLVRLQTDKDRATGKVVLAR